MASNSSQSPQANRGSAQDFGQYEHGELDVGFTNPSTSGSPENEHAWGNGSGAAVKGVELALEQLGGESGRGPGLLPGCERRLIMPLKGRGAARAHRAASDDLAVGNSAQASQ
jgi:hypothetical protein